MRKNLPKALLMGAVLSAALVAGAAPSFADMAPSDAGISDADWASVLEIGNYNNAYTEYVDDSGEINLVFTGGNVPDSLNYPSDFTGFQDPNLTMWGEYSQFATNDAIPAIQDDIVTQVTNAGYNVGAGYDVDTDQIDVLTLAPASVTDPLVATYGSEINVVAQDPAAQSAPGGAAHGYIKKQATTKHAPRKGAVGRHVKNAPAPTVVKVPLTLGQTR